MSKRGDRRCGTCRFARPETKGWLSCTRYPPAVPVPGEEVLGAQMTDFPKVLPDGWPCGEWKRKGKK